MDITIQPGKLNGSIHAIASKSQAHRVLICAAFSNSPTSIICTTTNKDIQATVSCLEALGALIVRTEDGYHVTPVKSLPQTAHLDCAESGSTLRFMLPIVCALGIETTIHMSGRLPYRPLSPLWEELERNGCLLTRPSEQTIHTKGKLRAGDYTISGNVSSQYISGLLFALSMVDGESQIHIIGNLESKPYVEMTQHVLKNFAVDTENYHVHGCVPYHSPGNVSIEGDWSNAAFFLAANELGNCVEIFNLNPQSSQGDRAITSIFSISDTSPTISASDIPDLIPILAVYFAAKDGATFTNIFRLRLKESDRVATIISLLKNLGINAHADDNTLWVSAGKFKGGVIDAVNDHRIAMAAAIASTVAEAPITILGAECVSKSYPSFWQEFRRLGGRYEQYIR